MKTGTTWSKISFNAHDLNPWQRNIIAVTHTMRRGVLYVYHRCGCRKGAGQNPYGCREGELSHHPQRETVSNAVQPLSGRVDMSMSLFSVLFQDMTMEQANEERLERV